jgi:hypothetical protein
MGRAHPSPIRSTRFSLCDFLAALNRTIRRTLPPSFETSSYRCLQRLSRNQNETLVPKLVS